MSMILGIWLLCVALSLLILIVAVRLKKFEKIASEASAGLLLASFPFLFTAQLPLLVVAIGLVIHLSLFVLPARMLMGRLERQFLQHSTEVNAGVGLILIGLLVALYSLGVFAHTDILLAIVVSAALAVLVLFFGQLLWNTRHYHVDTPAKPLAIKDLPTVSLCIPARNEDHALTECLAAAIASDYPKLEILVLDDCSQDTTLSIIRSFAHDGVRFVQGTVPSSGWLGKNQAMQTLAEHASGEYVAFMCVDTIVSPQTVSKMMRYMLAHNLQMVSALPQNRFGASLPTLLPTLDYFWRLVWPVTRRHVPVSSKFWLVKANSLLQMGGFASVSRKVLPEESFARRLFNLHGYHFVVGSADTGLTTAKRWQSQVATSLRLMYPTMKRQPLLALGVASMVIVLCIVPLVSLIALLAIGSHGLLFLVSLAATLLLTLNYVLIVVRSHPKSWLLTTLLWPLAVLQEACLLVGSMLLYEFGEVNWKGRNVCYPVLGLPQPSAQSRQAEQ